ncbi:MAG: hypothetical protein EBT35_06105, partial [Alphaproteobacteria bacterium]|nr:hypothetical protein [Alphaproteobacteria bacterium]
METHEFARLLRDSLCVQWNDPDMMSSRPDFDAALDHALTTAHHSDKPYQHWFVSGVFPKPVADALLTLPFPVPDLG